MITRDLLIPISLGVASNLITAALLAVLRWQVRKLEGVAPDWKTRLAVWFYLHLKGIVLTGLLIDAAFLAWLLIKFPTVNIWTVLAIVVCIVLSAVQLTLYLISRIVRSVGNSVSKFLKDVKPSLAAQKHEQRRKLVSQEPSGLEATPTLEDSTARSPTSPDSASTSPGPSPAKADSNVQREPGQQDSEA